MTGEEDDELPPADHDPLNEGAVIKSDVKYNIPQS
jgi:hypothetical protein